jgi:decaprenyl-phosphate phosphoribosyltransferase
MKKLQTIIQLLRIKSWLKNGFVMFPLIFSLNLFNKELVLHSILAFLSFCFISSVIYIINDIADTERDRLHPRKSKRPLASGTISVNNALIILLFCTVFATLFLLPLHFNFILYALIYLVVNVLYSFWLKKINLVESFIISLNFLFRVLAGCAAISVVPSEWIVAITFFISLFLVFIKRKSEIRMLTDKATAHRGVLRFYTPQLLDKFIYISATITIAGYLLYTVNEEVVSFFGSNRLMYTTVFVVLGIFRFIQLSDSRIYEEEGDPTSLILSDRFVQIVILCWLILTTLILYFL